jgi:hypothetical protein
MAKKIDFTVLGFSGLKQYGGLIDEEFLAKLRGVYGPKVYREMADNSSTIGAIQYLFKALVRQVGWRVETSEPTKEAMEQAEFVESCLFDMEHTFEDFISEVLSMFPYGWSYFEIIYKMRRGQDTKDPKQQSAYDDGKIGWRKLSLRAQDTLERWEFDEEGNLKGLHQQHPSSGQAAFVPIEKAILFRTETTKDNPQGRSLYRNAVIDWFYLKRISEIEAIGVERDLTGLPVMQVPERMLDPSASSDNKALLVQLQTMLSQVKRDEREYAIVPSEINDEGKPTGYKFSLLTTGGTRQFDTDKTKNYYKTSILQSVLAQFIQLGMTNVGSWALASSQTETFGVALGAYLDVIAATFTRFGIYKLMEANGVKREYWPEIVHGDLESLPLAEVGAYIQALYNTEQLPEGDEAIQRKLLELAKLPMPQKDESEKPEPTKKRRGLLKALPSAGKKSPVTHCTLCGKGYIGKPLKCPSCGEAISRSA